MENLRILFQILAMLALSPLLFGIINKVKAVFAGRQGRSVFKLYYDIYKLLNRGAVYSNSVTALFKIAPVAILSLTITAALIVPFGGQKGVISFPGDFIFFSYILAMSRFVLILSAMDTASSFEGMGASREAQFAVFSEPVFFMAMITLSKITGQISIYGIFSRLNPSLWVVNAPVLTLLVFSLFILMLCEAARVPFDDPETHLELTMIHEVMILDNSGPDLAYILYASSIKMWIFASFISSIILPRHSDIFWSDCLFYLAGIFLSAVAVAVTESVMARLRLLRVPHFLMAAFSVSVMAFVFQSFKG